MNPVETRLERALREALTKALSKKAEDIVQGMSSFDGYREAVGYAKALKDALVMLDKARAESIQGR